MASRLKVLLDSSIWIAVLRGSVPWTAEYSAHFFFNNKILVADLVYVEVVRGAKTAAESFLISSKLNDFEQVSVGGVELARKAVENHQLLRTKGITVRGTVDLMIATWCIENNTLLMHADRDYSGFEQHLGLQVWRGE